MGPRETKVVNESAAAAPLAQQVGGWVGWHAGRIKGVRPPNCGGLINILPYVYHMTT